MQSLINTKDEFKAYIDDPQFDSLKNEFKHRDNGLNKSFEE